jgi:5-(carboxyamino)imidazole ribonucleotide synthase
MTRIGIFGGGQLAQMLTQAMLGLGLEVVIFERTADSPASRYTRHSVVGAWDDPVALAAFAEQCDLVTLENEFVDAQILTDLAARGLPIYPTPETIATVQDKLLQKKRLSAAGLPVPAFCAVNSPNDVLGLAQSFGWPLLLKARRDGYDGYGNATIHSPADLPAAWERLAKGERSLFVEEFVPFSSELAIMVVRSSEGVLRTYPLVETVQHNHICHVVRAPAALSAAVAANATTMATAAIEAINGIGIFGVELFLLANGQVLINELAPRPHNSGHYSIEACVTSQFENHARAILGWPLGSTALQAPAAVMVNILGRYNGPAPTHPARAALAIEGAHIHLYGKREVRVGRKMGHVTALAATIAEAEAIARRAADLVEL